MELTTGSSAALVQRFGQERVYFLQPGGHGPTNEPVYAYGTLRIVTLKRSNRCHIEATEITPGHGGCGGRSWCTTDYAYVTDKFTSHNEAENSISIDVVGAYVEANLAFLQEIECISLIAFAEEYGTDIHLHRLPKSFEGIHELLGREQIGTTELAIARVRLHHHLPPMAIAVPSPRTALRMVARLSSMLRCANGSTRSASDAIPRSISPLKSTMTSCPSSVTCDSPSK